MQDHSSPVAIRVLIAGTGAALKINLPRSDLTIANIRSRLAAAVPTNDQIILLGPPYKIPKDPLLQSEETLKALRLGDVEDDPHTVNENEPSKILSATEKSGAKRLFLFSKRALSENAPDPAPCQLAPLDVDIPTESAPLGPSPLNLDPSTNPLHHALGAYERQFMLYLAQGQALADAADMRYLACYNCVKEQAVLARALRAAVSNLSDHYHSATRTRAEFTTQFQEKAAHHSNLLQKFESILSSLSNIPLHPALVSTARASGREMETLLDTVPVERERTWAQQCRSSHERIMTLFGDLENSFQALGTPSSREEESRYDREAEDDIQVLWEEVEIQARQRQHLQASRFEALTTDQSQVVRIIIDATNSSNEDDVQAAFTPLRELSNASKTVIQNMLEEDATLRQLMIKVSESKTMVMKRMKIRLREISKMQSLIQRVLSSVGVLRDALNQQSENMAHMEHVSELPGAYRDFLSEICRRRAYGQAITSTLTAMMERIANIRNDEVRIREKFLRGSGRHLMPAFYDIFAPTLATPPSLFAPQLPSMVELDALPDVSRDTSDTIMHSALAEHGISSASTLTTDSHPQHDTLDHQHEGLIVSADEQSNLIVDPLTGATAEAEAKTLAYENAVLRQALERIGGKSPSFYLDQAVAHEKASASVTETEIATLRKDLAAAQLEAKKAQDALAMTMSSVPDWNRENDKISHSSFRVGDVGLFMPTGRGSGGKRTYLAFHTNCPHRYLNTDNIKGSPDFVLGRIIFQEELLAGDIGTDQNPYGLHVGTKFWVLTVDVLKSHA